MTANPKTLYTYAGIDSHADTQTAVFLDCFFTKVGEVQFENRLSKFGKFLNDAEKLKIPGTSLLFGMEDISAYGRALTVFLKGKGYKVKHVNASLVAHERKNQNVPQKTDAIDAECVARTLLSKFESLPDAAPDDKYWVLRTLVIRRESIVKQNISLKNHLHTLINDHYPSYGKIFANIDCKTSLAFLSEYPSPYALRKACTKELDGMLWELSNGRAGVNKAQRIFDIIEQDGNLVSDYQDARDNAVRSTIRQLVFNQGEIDGLEKELADFLELFDYPLTSMKGISTVMAARLISCIGDIKKFPTPGKLSRYAGVAPITYSSGKKDVRYSNQRGNRELNSLFYHLSVLVTMKAGRHNKIINPILYDYYHKKQAEGKTKRQSLKCVQRRLVNIIWGIMTYNQPYINPPSYNLPEDEGKKA